MLELLLLWSASNCPQTQLKKTAIKTLQHQHGESAGLLEETGRCWVNCTCINDKQACRNHSHPSGSLCIPLTCVSWAIDPCVASSAAGRDSRCRWGQRAAGQSVDNSLCLGAHRETCNTHKHTHRHLKRAFKWADRHPPGQIHPDGTRRLLFPGRLRSVSISNQTTCAKFPLMD